MNKKVTKSYRAAYFVLPEVYSVYSQGKRLLSPQKIIYNVNNNVKVAVNN